MNYNDKLEYLILRKKKLVDFLESDMLSEILKEEKTAVNAIYAIIEEKIKRTDSDLKDMLDQTSYLDPDVQFKIWDRSSNRIMQIASEDHAYDEMMEIIREERRIAIDEMD